MSAAAPTRPASWPSAAGTTRTARAKASWACRRKASSSGSNSSGPACDSPPPMATTSRSSRWVAEASATPRARPARRIAASATSCPRRASSASSRAVASPATRPCARHPCCWAHRASDGPLAIASRQPRPPQTQPSPSGSTTTWPMCPALPCAPEMARPSRMRPPPTPVETTMPSRLGTPRPAPRQCSPTVRHIASLCTRTGIAGSLALSRARSGNPCQAGMFSGETSPSGQTIGPPQPTPTPPTPSGPALASTASSSASTAPHSVSASTWRPVGVGVRPECRTRPVRSTRATAILLPPTSTASTGRRSSGSSLR